MAERLQDEADKMLESLFRSEPVRDDGFSVNVVKRVRRKMWIQRLSMPVAIVIGVAIAAKPLVQLSTAIPNLLTAVPSSVGSVGIFEGISVSSLPQTSTIILGLVLLGAILMASQLLEE
jgi:hypothetical protein